MVRLKKEKKEFLKEWKVKWEKDNQLIQTYKELNEKLTEKVEEKEKIINNIGPV